MLKFFRRLSLLQQADQHLADAMAASNAETNEPKLVNKHLPHIAQRQLSKASFAINLSEAPALQDAGGDEDD